MDIRALECAIKKGDITAVKRLLRDGVYNDQVYGSALHMACTENSPEIVKFLLERGANFRIHDDLPLCLMSRHGHLDVVMFLVEHGANVCTMDNKPIILASEGNHPKLIKYLVEKGADVRTKMSYALHKMVEVGNLDMVKFLLKRGAQVHPWDLIRSCSNGELEMAKILLENGELLGENLYATDTKKEKLNNYILFCKRMEEKRRIWAANKIRNCLLRRISQS